MQLPNFFGHKPVYIVDGARTPFLKMKGRPNPFAASDLAVNASRNLLLRQPILPTDFSEVIWGSVMPGPTEANIGRVISLRLGCGREVPAFTVARNCASGLQAIDTARRNIMLGDSQLVLAGGTDSMSHAPLLFDDKMVLFLADLATKKTFSAKLAHILKFRPWYLTPVISIMKGLKDPIVDLSMGQTAEELAFLYDITREEMDAYSIRSHKRAIAAYAEGRLSEIIPMYDAQGNVYTKDEGVRDDGTIEKLGKLRSVFDKFGNITAANSSQISDGAAAVILASEEALDTYKLTPKARIVDITWAGVDPEVMGLGPVHSIAMLLKNHKLSFSDVSHVEINEAFAAQVLACNKLFANTEYCATRLGMDAPGSIPEEKLNPDGGAVSIGHPVGASGARLAIHAANELVRTQGRYAITSLCIGGGQGGAMLIERV